jgi:hypothetical protein
MQVNPDMLMATLVFLYTTGKGWVYRDISIDDFLVSKEGGQSCYELTWSMLST